MAGLVFVVSLLLVGGLLFLGASLLLGRVGVLDTMLITSWEPPRRVDVRHTGRVVRGTGTFEVRPRDGGGSTFVWTEGLDLPLGALGRAGWPLVRPVMAAGVRLSLRRFAAYAQAHPA